MPIMKNLGVLSAATTTLAIISFFVFGGFEHQVNSVDHGGKCHRKITTCECQCPQIKLGHLVFLITLS